MKFVYSQLLSGVDSVCHLMVADYSPFTNWLPADCRLVASKRCVNWEFACMSVRSLQPLLMTVIIILLQFFCFFIDICFCFVLRICFRFVCSYSFVACGISLALFRSSPRSVAFLYLFLIFCFCVFFLAFLSGYS